MLKYNLLRTISICIISISYIFAVDTNQNGIDDNLEHDFAEMYAPILNYHQNNPLFPMPVDAIYSETDFQNASNGYVPLPINDHTPQGWQNYFVNTLLPQNITPTVYYNIITQTIDPGIVYTVIQYWFYYPFNDASNIHEGDWEHIAVIVDGLEPNTSTPVGVVFHHHYILDRFSWQDLETTGNHVNVYIGGETKLNVLLLDYTRDEDCSSAGGYEEITGGSFPSDGFYPHGWYTTIGPGSIHLLLSSNELIQPNRTLLNEQYSLVNLRNDSDPNLWWSDDNVFFGVPASTLDNISCDKTIYTPIEITFPYPFPTDPPKSPYFSNYYDNYDIVSSSENNYFNLESAGDYRQIITYNILTDAEVTITIFTTGGSEVLSFTNSEEIGFHKFQWDKRNQSGEPAGGSSFRYSIETNPASLFATYSYYGLREEETKFTNKTNSAEDIGGLMDLNSNGFFASGTKLWLYDDSNYNIKTLGDNDNALIGEIQYNSQNYKHNNWNGSGNNYLLNHDFNPLDGDQDAIYEELNTITFTSNNDIAIDILDPWRVNGSGQQPGNEYIPVDGQYQVFLNQDPNQGMQNYSLRAPYYDGTDQNNIWIFKEWKVFRSDGTTEDTNQSWVSILNPSNLESIVIFKQANAVVKAIYYEANLIENYTLNIGIDGFYNNLTIPSGAQIQFAPGFKIELFGLYELNILGTEEEPIILDALNNQNWEGLVIRNDGILNIENTVIRNANTGITFDFWDNVTNNPPDKHINKVEFENNDTGVLIELKNQANFVESDIYIDQCNFTNNLNGIRYSQNEQNGTVPFDHQINTYITNSSFINSNVGIELNRNAEIVDISNCVFDNNTRGININIVWPASEQITHNFSIGRNLFTSNGDGIFINTECFSGNLAISNNTFDNNQYFGVFSPVLNDMFQCTAINNIIANGQGGINLDVNDHINYNDFYNIQINHYPADGIGNIELDPNFVDPQNGDYHLSYPSPAIDAGDPNSPLDPDGTVADMGVYYYQLPISELFIEGEVGDYPTFYWEHVVIPDYSHHEVWRYNTTMGQDGALIALVSGDTWTDTDFVISQIDVGPDGNLIYKVESDGEGEGYNQRVNYQVRARDINQHNSPLSNQVHTYRWMKGGVPHKTLSEPEIPDHYTLNNAYPNPFNPVTRIKFGLPEKSNIQLVIYDLLGREIFMLKSGATDPGWFIIQWEGINNSGKKVPSGIYIYTLIAESLESEKTFMETKKMVLLK